MNKLREKFEEKFLSDDGERQFGDDENGYVVTPDAVWDFFSNERYKLLIKLRNIFLEKADLGGDVPMPYIDKVINKLKKEV